MCNILISIIVNIIAGLLLIMFLNIWYKKRIKKAFYKDTRVYEALYEAFLLQTLVIKPFEEFDLINQKYEKDGLVDYKNRKYQKEVQEFYRRYYRMIKIQVDIIISRKTDVIYDMADKGFYILNDFKMIDIINNLKNRACNFLEEDMVAKIEKEKDNEEKVRLINRIIVDIKHHINYFEDLLKYIKFYKWKTKGEEDDIRIKMVKYLIVMDVHINEQEEELMAINKKIRRKGKDKN